MKISKYPISYKPKKKTIETTKTNVTKFDQLYQKNKC